MAVLLGIYSVLKFVSSLIFKGPLNFSIEILFWIINGIIFGPFKGPLFSLLCDTVFTFFTTGIAYWMIEYAIIPPIVSLLSWLFWKTYKEKNKITIIFSLLILIISITSVLIIFFIQFFDGKFRYEGVSQSKVIPFAVYILVSIFCFVIFCFSILCLILFYVKNDWKYIKWLHSMALVVVIIILSRWLWGPYAYLEYMKRFYSKHINFERQYPLTLFGIVIKSCVTIPLASIIIVPLISIYDKFKFNLNSSNGFDDEKNKKNKNQIFFKIKKSISNKNQF